MFCKTDKKRFAYNKINIKITQNLVGKTIVAYFEGHF